MLWKGGKNSGSKIQGPVGSAVSNSAAGMTVQDNGPIGGVSEDPPCCPIPILAYLGTVPRSFQASSGAFSMATRFWHQARMTPARGCGLAGLMRKES
jgi:hypothetical protein